MADSNKIIGYKIAETRGKADESQADLAAALGVKREMVTYWENGTRPIKAETIIEIAKRYNVSADYLLGLSEHPTVSEDMKTALKVTGLSQKAIEKIVYWSVDDLFLDSLDRFLSSDSSADFIGALSTVIGNSVAIPAQWEAQKDEFASQSGFPDELSELEYYLKELKYSVFEVSESAASLVSDIAGIDQLKKKLNARIAEIVKERYHGGE